MTENGSNGEASKDDFAAGTTLKNETTKVESDQVRQPNKTREWLKLSEAARIYQKNFDNFNNTLKFGAVNTRICRACDGQDDTRVKGNGRDRRISRDYLNSLILDERNKQLKKEDER